MRAFRDPGMTDTVLRFVLAVASAAALAAFAADAASAQAAQPPAEQRGLFQAQPPQTTAVPPPAQAAQQAPSAFPAQPPPAAKPGFVYAFGQWWDTARDKFGNPLGALPNDAAKGAATAQDVMRNAAQATKDAATAIVRLPGARFIEVHQICAVAPNGAPDCRTAAAAACRAKGFRDGHPANVQSSQNCPPAVWMSGREPAAGECPDQTVVLLAACD